MLLLPFETVAEHEAVWPAWAFGVLALVVLLVALTVVRMVGLSRPHS